MRFASENMEADEIISLIVSLLYNYKVIIFNMKSANLFSGGNELLDPNKIFDKLEIKPGSRIADLGCGGSGHFIIPAASLVGSETNVYAVDILKSVLKNIVSSARIRGVNNIKPIWSNLEVYGATKIKDNSLDFAFLFNILFQSKKQKEIIKESLRLLKKGGKLAVIDWKDTNFSFGPPLEIRVKKEIIKKIALGLSLELVEEFKAGNYHYGLIFKK